MAVPPDRDPVPFAVEEDLDDGLPPDAPREEWPTLRHVLTERQFDALLLCVIQGFSFRAAGRFLGIGHSSARKLYLRALRRVKAAQGGRLRA